jgi:hypothetical protein
MDEIRQRTVTPMQSTTPEEPTFRKLRGYAFDPSLSNRLETYIINEITYDVAWENVETKNGCLTGEYLEIIDYDPSADTFYKMIDLNDQHILAKNGLDPSESNPMFHQQMVYAVAMTTIKNFENALGRKVIWSPRRLDYNGRDKKKYEEYVDKLRIYPHALREANAYYSPQKKALLFGYFYSNPGDDNDQMPGSLVFTCLSHDIIAHEITHAILDGMQIHYNDATNPDVLAFHEAFADIVALFQHFSFPEVLVHQIARTRGDLASQNLLGELAHQFGRAIGSYGSLRDAIGRIDPETKKWEPIEPDPMDYKEIMEPHQRGSILVAAVFDAFISVYKRRVSDLFRIASGGTGVLPKGELHPDLVNRLAKEASKTSGIILDMCIRAIDYCPPVDITFGDYLQAIITSDHDLVKNDQEAFRLAFIEAFRRRGIFPEGIKSLSVESLRLPQVTLSQKGGTLMGIIAEFLRDYAFEIGYRTNREDIYRITKMFITGIYSEEDNIELGTTKVLGLHSRIGEKFENREDFINISGLALVRGMENYGVSQSPTHDGPSYQVKNLRLVSRVGPGNNKINQVVFSITQSAGVVIENGKMVNFFSPGRGGSIPKRYEETGFIFNAGCTFILELATTRLRYAIPKKLLVPSESEKGCYKLNDKAIERQWNYMNEAFSDHSNEFQRYFSPGMNQSLLEPFALLHQL